MILCTGSLLPIQNLLHNKYVYEKYKFVPRHPAIIHQFEVGEIIKWYPDDCTAGQTDQHIQFNRTNLEQHDWGDLIIASDKVTASSLKSEAKFDGGDAVSAEASLALNFEDNDQQVTKADGCECSSWNASTQDLKWALEQLFTTKKEHLKHGSYAVILSVITAKYCSVFHGHKNQFAVTSKLGGGSVVVPVSANLSIDWSKKTEISYVSDPLQNRVVGFQIWPFNVSWWRRAIKLGEQRVGPDDGSNDGVDVSTDSEYDQVDTSRGVRLS